MGHLQGPRLMAWTTKSPIWGNHWVPLGGRALLGSVEARESDNPNSFIFSDKLWQDVDPKDFACKPDIRVPQSVVFSQPGANVTLSCFIIGNPMPDAKWVLKVGFIFFISCIYRIF